VKIVDWKARFCSTESLASVTIRNGYSDVGADCQGLICYNERPDPTGFYYNERPDTMKKGYTSGYNGSRKDQTA